MRLLALALALMPAAAEALSCLPPNPARELDAAFRDGHDPRLLIGRLTTPFDNESGTYRFEGRVVGHGVSVQRLSSAIEVSASCVDEWCGKLPRRPVEGLFVSIHPEGGLKLTLGPCGTGRYQMPSEAQLRALEACVEAQGCPAETIEAFED